MTPPPLSLPHPPSYLHHPQPVHKPAEGEDALADADDEGEADGAEADAQDPVHEEASNHRQHNIWPGVPGAAVRLGAFIATRY